MIFERRAYLLKPGYAQAFWAAQERWNEPAVFGPLLQHNLFYASRASRVGTLIVHLYRFANLAEWQQLYESYYRQQAPAYFSIVRPWMTSQENSFLRPTGSAALDGFPRRLDAGPGTGSPDLAQALVVETTVDLLPGGLPAFVEAADREGADAVGAVSGQHLGTLISLVGRQHRVVHYHLCHSRAEAKTCVQRIEAVIRSGWNGTAVRPIRTLLLTPSPLPSRRRAIEPYAVR